MEEVHPFCVSGLNEEMSLRGRKRKYQMIERKRLPNYIKGTLIGLLVLSMVPCVTSTNKSNAQEQEYSQGKRKKKVVKPATEGQTQPRRHSIRVPSGTSVPVVITEKVTAGQYKAGSEITGKVGADVTSSGIVIIRSGTPVSIIVEDVKKKGAVGSQARMTISLKTTSAVDGTLIALTGTKFAEGTNRAVSSVACGALCCILGLLQQGGEAEIPAGTQIEGRTAQEATITLD